MFPRPFLELDRVASKPERLVVGMMSGTSADSIDVAVCRISGDLGGVRLLHYEEHGHDPDDRARILAIREQGVRELAELHVAVAERFAAACLKTLRHAGIEPSEIDLVGSHGQTVYHHSGVPGALRATLQIGDGDIIAVRTGRPVIADFRARDIAAGGEGAPLSPIADAVMYAPNSDTHAPKRRAVLNLGGIANVTVLDVDHSRISGFDTGPANAPLDRLARRLTDGAQGCDVDGRIARSGRVNVDLLAQLLEADSFLARRPPKSTGFEMYGDLFVEQAITSHGAADADLMATLTEFTAATIARAFRDFILSNTSIDEVIVAGGGVKNPFLMERIAALLAPIAVLTSDEVGIPSNAREAMAFAVLADMTLRGVAAWLPPVTGASHPKLLGKLCFP
ncbi:MAG: anhydro-N-acetylmuramic acid kinase [Isosphaeraceae bacterium]